MKPLLERVQDEADLCRNEGAQDIANLLDEVARELEGGDWQCRDYADGWITFPDRAAAERYQSDTGALMRVRRNYPAQESAPQASPRCGHCNTPYALNGDGWRHPLADCTNAGKLLDRQSGGARP